jgi:predicted negative regulator of RcsB-dependent stress response
MKSAHRHQLETNALAQRLDVMIERMRPYAAVVAGAILAVVVIMFVWSYVTGTSAAQQGAAWDAYHRAVTAVPPNLDQLRRSAEEYPRTKMEQLANITWADGQVLMASRDYIHNRAAAMEALQRATSAYQGILQTTDNERLVNRAHLGLARVYEMQGELEKAREEYLKVGGGYAELARQQADRLAEPQAKETYAWLATAQAPRPRAPAGPGTPGERPEFSAGDFPLPGAEAGAPDGSTDQSETFENLLRGFDLGFPKADEADDTDRYDAGTETPATDGEAPQGEVEKTDIDESEPAPEDK